jgi:hypothetical protein
MEEEWTSFALSVSSVSSVSSVARFQGAQSAWVSLRSAHPTTYD